jgi:hypothetical protein
MRLNKSRVKLQVQVYLTLQSCLPKIQQVHPASYMQALIQAFTAGSGMGSTAHREQSTQVVVNSFLQALSSMAGK